MQTYQNVFELSTELTDSSTELRWATFAWKPQLWSTLNQTEKKEVFEFTACAGFPELGSGLFPRWAVTWLLTPFSPKIPASGYHNRMCLAYFIEGLFRDSVAPVSTTQCGVWLTYLINVWLHLLLIFLTNLSDLSTRSERARLPCGTVVGDFSLLLLL